MQEPESVLTSLFFKGDDWDEKINFRDPGTHCSRWQPHSGVGYSQRRCELRGGGEEERGRKSLELAEMWTGELR